MLPANEAMFMGGTSFMARSYFLLVTCQKEMEVVGHRGSQVYPRSWLPWNAIAMKLVKPWRKTDRDVYELGSGASVGEGQNPEVVEWNTDEQEGKSHTD
ncbi:hypothetical protein EJB05_31998, partial [Eragrostis curvula]